MGITSYNKTVDTDSISCNGTVKVTLALTASPDITSNPVDIVLVLDRSGSMAGSPIANLKNGAKKFIDIIYEATTTNHDGNIGSGSRIGIVSFADVATQDTGLITSVASLDATVNALSAGGNTNHGDAFTKAINLFDPSSSNNKVIVMFTDGETTTGPDPSPIAAAARAQGITIFVIGLVGSTGIDEDALRDWATDPDSTHVAITPNDEELENLFENLAENISNPGATNIDINEKINPDFKITTMLPATKGTASMLDSNTIRWTIDKLGITNDESAVLEFFIQHIALTSGTKHVNASITYTDTEGNQVTFPDPVVEVDCGTEVIAEPCPDPVDVVIEGCTDSLEFDAGDVSLESLGCILQLSMTIKNVCPNRRVALGVVLTEVDSRGTEHPRGLKTVTIPAHQHATCRDIKVRCIKFVLPEDLDVSGDSTASMCNDRHFKARMIVHYIDNDFECCHSADEL